MKMVAKRASPKTGKTASQSDRKAVRDLKALYLRGMPLTPKAAEYLTEVLWLSTQATALATGKTPNEIMLGYNPASIVHAAIEQGLRMLSMNLKAVGVEQLAAGMKGRLPGCKGKGR